MMASSLLPKLPPGWEYKDPEISAPLAPPPTPLANKKAPKLLPKNHSYKRPQLPTQKTINPPKKPTRVLPSTPLLTVPSYDGWYDCPCGYTTRYKQQYMSHMSVKHGIVGKEGSVSRSGRVKRPSSKVVEVMTAKKSKVEEKSEGVRAKSPAFRAKGANESGEGGFYRAKLKVGDRITGRYSGSGQKLPGVICSDNRNGSFLVLFDNQERETLTLDCIEVEKRNRTAASAGRATTRRPKLSNVWSAAEDSFILAAAKRHTGSQYKPCNDDVFWTAVAWPAGWKQVTAIGLKTRHNELRRIKELQPFLRPPKASPPSDGDREDREHLMVDEDGDILVEDQEQLAEESRPLEQPLKQPEPPSHTPSEDIPTRASTPSSGWYETSVNAQRAVAVHRLFGPAPLQDYSDVDPVSGPSRKLALAQSDPTGLDCHEQAGRQRLNHLPEEPVYFQDGERRQGVRELRDAASLSSNQLQNFSALGRQH